MKKKKKWCNYEYEAQLRAVSSLVFALGREDIV